jgi:hypothetical protein
MKIDHNVPKVTQIDPDDNMLIFGSPLRRS